MNLQINLILDTERRSGSNVSQKFLIRTGLSVVVAIVVLMAAFVFIAAGTAKKSRAAAESDKKQLTAQYLVLQKTKKDLTAYQNLDQDVRGWRETRVGWYRLLRGLQTHVPPNAQIRRFTADEKIETPDGVASRGGGLFIQGKVVGTNLVAIQQFDAALRTASAFSNIFEHVQVKRIAGADNPDEKNVLLFDIECKFAMHQIGRPKPPEPPPEP